MHLYLYKPLAAVR